jgi:hypothetical protein
VLLGAAAVVLSKFFFLPLFGVGLKNNFWGGGGGRIMVWDCSLGFHFVCTLS